MSVITAAAEITAESLPGQPDDDWWHNYLRLDNERSRQLVAAANSQPLFTYVDVTMQHGVQTTRANPFAANGVNATIVGIYPVRCAQLLLDSSGRVTNTTAPLGLPTIEWHPNTQKNDGSVLATATLPSPIGAYVLRQSGSLTAASAATVAMTWNTEDVVIGTALSHSTSTNPSRVTCNLPGIVYVSGSAIWQANSSGTRESFVGKNGTTSGTNTRWAYGNYQPGAGGSTGTPRGSRSFADYVPVSAGDYLELQTFQDSGSTLNIGTVDTFGDCRMSVAYVSQPPVSVPTYARVRLLFIGVPQ